MSVLQLFSNNAVSLLNASISATDTSLQVQPGLGSLFPQPSLPGEYFLVTLETLAAPFSREIIKVTGRSGDTFTFSLLDRAQEGTTAQAWTANDTLVDHRVTADTLKSLAATSAGPDARVYDAPFDISYTITSTILSLAQTFVPNSSAVWVGGLRMKRGIDYTEGPMILTINSVIPEEDITAGQNIVVDYTPTI